MQLLLCKTIYSYYYVKLYSIVIIYNYSYYNYVKLNIELLLCKTIFSCHYVKLYSLLLCITIVNYYYYVTLVI